MYAGAILVGDYIWRRHQNSDFKAVCILRLTCCVSSWSVRESSPNSKTGEPKRKSNTWQLIERSEVNMPDLIGWWNGHQRTLLGHVTITGLKVFIWLVFSARTFLSTPSYSLLGGSAGWYKATSDSCLFQLYINAFHIYSQAWQKYAHLPVKVSNSLVWNENIDRCCFTDIA